MSDKSWERDQQSRKRVLQGTLAGIVTIAIAAVVLYNNREILSPHSNDADGDVIHEKEDGPSSRDAFSIADTEVSSVKQQQRSLTIQTKPAAVPQIAPPAAVKPAEIKQEAPKSLPAAEHHADVKDARAPPVHCDSVDLPGIDCTITGRKDLLIQISLLLYVDDCEMTKQVLLKREDLKVLVKKVMKTKEFGQIQTELLRRELLENMNGVLEQGGIADMLFKDFRIEEVKK